MKMTCSLHNRPAQVVTELEKLFILLLDLFSLAAEDLAIFLSAFPILLHTPDIILHPSLHLRQTFPITCSP